MYFMCGERWEKNHEPLSAGLQRASRQVPSLTYAPHFLSPRTLPTELLKHMKKIEFNKYIKCIFTIKEKKHKVSSRGLKFKP